MPELSIVIPAFNEARRLVGSIERIASFLAGQSRSAEVIVVDDGSNDGTTVTLEALEGRIRVERHRVNRGKGAALRTGVLASKGDVVLLTDADLSTPIEELARLETFLGKHQLVFASRATPDTLLAERQPVYRELMGRTFNRIIRTYLRLDIRDTQCGFKLLDGGCARSLFSRLKVDRFAYDVELAWLARREGLSIAEVGVQWSHCDDSKVSLVRDSLRMLYDVARIPALHRGRT